MKSPNFPKAEEYLNELNLDQEFRKTDERGRCTFMDGYKLEAIPEKVTKTLLYEAGIFPYTEHGIINPSCAQTARNKYKIIFRTEPTESTWMGHLLQDKGVPQVSDAKITKKGIQLKDPKPIESGMIMSCRPEDWRLFNHNGKIYCNFTNYFYYNKGWPQKVARCTTSLGVLTDTRIQFVRECTCEHLNVKMQNEEKNWVFFSHNDQLWCIYSIEPWIVFRCDNTGLPHEIMSQELTLPRLGNRYIANSTNPIPVHIPNLGDVFLMFVHQYFTPNGKGSRNRTYYQHVLIIDPEKMAPIAWTPFPIVGGGQSTVGRHDGVVYISGAFIFNQKLYALAGEGDTNCVMFELTLKDLFSRLTLL